MECIVICLTLLLICVAVCVSCVMVHGMEYDQWNTDRALRESKERAKEAEERVRQYETLVKNLTKELDRQELANSAKTCKEEQGNCKENCEDERIKKEILDLVSISGNGNQFEEIKEWLEKQESLKDIIDRYKDSWYNEGKIAGMAEGLTDDEKYQQGWHDALEKQGEQKPFDYENATIVEKDFSLKKGGKK